ncbi:radical SAM protein [Actinomadura livida]|uniref:Putative pyruvate formate lyase activating enzyme n=1 Tax=Actinomadura livida TaxID=79909 RepID=A0A7W7N0X6_9ACTN|nr:MULTISPECIES: radical SAM protein [Actinomadura]MBB4777367.1 putative pyruvate formate lyase activating enzyme [Actinomadura catellatispora]GGU19729.1 radical SAM protein [Actinomadura livida]
MLDVPGLVRRAEVSRRLLGPELCRVCPRLCRADRAADETGLCGIGRDAVVAAHFPHFGEEDCIRGRRGSGTIFFSGCSLRCVFCQNHDVSWIVQGERVTERRMAEMMLELQARGCHNINLLTPEHVVPQILAALPVAVSGGLEVPIVYNSSGYEGTESLALLDGVVDVYLPDLKVAGSGHARRYLRRPDYPRVARSAILEMHRQVGPLVLDESGLARRGLLVRHLVMPGMDEETAEVLRWIARELGSDTYVNLMAQYTPAGLVGGAGERGRYAEIGRVPGREEYLRAVDLAERLGLKRLDARSRAMGMALADEGAPRGD